MYNISDYTFDRAKKLGVEVKPSKKKNKKIDIFKDGKLIGSVGNTDYNDYTIYLKSHGKAYADEKRRLYRLRHAKDLKTGNGYLAANLLW